MLVARGPCWITTLLTLAERPFGTLQILNVSHRMLPSWRTDRVIRIGYFVSFLKLMVCFAEPTCHTVASRPGG